MSTTKRMIVNSETTTGLQRLFLMECSGFETHVATFDMKKKSKTIFDELNCNKLRLILIFTGKRFPSLNVYIYIYIYKQVIFSLNNKISIFPALLVPSIDPSQLLINLKFK